MDEYYKKFFFSDTDKFIFDEDNPENYERYSINEFIREHSNWQYFIIKLPISIGETVEIGKIYWFRGEKLCFLAKKPATHNYGTFFLVRNVEWEREKHVNVRSTRA